MREIVERLQENRQIELAKSILESHGYRVIKEASQRGSVKKPDGTNYTMRDVKSMSTEEMNEIFGDPLDTIGYGSYKYSHTNNSGYDVYKSTLPEYKPFSYEELKKLFNGQLSFHGDHSNGRYANEKLTKQEALSIIKDAGFKAVGKDFMGATVYANSRGQAFTESTAWLEGGTNFHPYEAGHNDQDVKVKVTDRPKTRSGKFGFRDELYQMFLPID